MSVTSNIEIVREWVEEIWNRGNLEMLARFHPHTFENEGRPSDIDDTRKWHAANRTTFPDLHYSIDEIFGANDRVILRWTASATQHGTLWGMIPATHKRVTWNGIHIIRLSEDRIVGIWALQNTAALLQQMGVRLDPGTP